MKRLFDKENFLFPTFSEKARRQSLILAGLIAIFFIASAFTFFNMLYCFADIIGSIVSGSKDVAIQDFLRVVPIFLSFFMTLWTLLLLHAFFRNVSDERRLRSLKKNAIVILVFAGVNIVYILTGLAYGRYLSLVEGSPSDLYPLDALLYSALFIAIGVVALIYRRKWQEKLPYVVPSRGPIVTRARFGYCLLTALWMLFALFGFAAFWIGLFVIDFVHGHAFYGIAYVLVCLVNFLFFFVWEFYYNEAKAEKRKEILLPLSFIGLGCSILVAALYFISLGLDLDAPSNMGFGTMPVAFAASVNIATMLVVMVPVIVSFVAMIKGFVIRNHKEPTKEQ